MAGLCSLAGCMSSWGRVSGRAEGDDATVRDEEMLTLDCRGHSVIVQVVSALVQATWTRPVPTVVEPPDGCTHSPEFTAMTWYSLVPTEVSVNSSLLA